MGAPVCELGFSAGRQRAGTARGDGSVHVASVPGRAVGYRARDRRGDRDRPRPRRPFRCHGDHPDQSRRRPATVPVAVTVAGTLDAADKETAHGASGWLFAAPQSRTATTRKVEGGSLVLEQGGLSVVVGKSRHRLAGRHRLDDPPAVRPIEAVPRVRDGPFSGGQGGVRRDRLRAERALAAMRRLCRSAGRPVRQLPRLRSSSPALDRFYNRSLVPLLMNRWDVAEFALYPTTRRGASTADAWAITSDFGGDWEIFPSMTPGRRNLTSNTSCPLTSPALRFRADLGEGVGAVVPGQSGEDHRPDLLLRQAYRGRGFPGGSRRRQDGPGARGSERDVRRRPREAGPTDRLRPSNSHLELRRGSPTTTSCPT